MKTILAFLGWVIIFGLLVTYATFENLDDTKTIIVGVIAGILLITVFPSKKKEQK